jgi:hypothetical protein
MSPNPATDFDVATWRHRFKTTPMPHQLIGVAALVRWDDTRTGRIVGGCFWLTDEMGVGKSKQVIDAAQVLYELGEIDSVIVVTLAPARGVWFDPELGELAKHLWDGVPCRVYEYHHRWRLWQHDVADRPGLLWIVTNYEFIRSEPRREQLERFTGQKTMIVFDESSAIKSPRAKQTRACVKLRWPCARVVELNGTPVSHTPLDVYAQAVMLAPLTKRGGSKILDCDTFTHYQARYAVKGGFLGKQVLGWQNLDELTAKLKPYVLRREIKDLPGLPPALSPVTLTATLTPETWRVYRSMRDQLVAALDAGTIAVASQAAVRVMRLAQITSGFVGGLEEEEEEETDEAEVAPTDRPAWIPAQDRLGATGDRPDGFDPVWPARTYGERPGQVREVGREKLDVALRWVEERLDQDQNVKLVIWCRFRPEVARLADAVGDRRGLKVARFWGGLRPTERDEVLRLLDPRTDHHGSALVVATAATGKMSFNFTAAHHALYFSNDYSLSVRQQSQARMVRPGQRFPVWFGDIIAEGPRGQKTVDHSIIKALRAHEDVATWTISRWRTALTEE